MVVLTAVALGFLPSVVPVSVASAGTPSPVVGAYVGPGQPDTADQLGASVGGHLNYAMDFLDPSTWSAFTDPTWPVSIWAGHGYRMIWGVPMLPNRGGSMSTGASGGYNLYFQTLARNLVAQGEGSSVLRIGWEFNGDWFPWGTSSGTPGQFITYWQQIVSTMRAVPGANFEFEWNPTRGGQVDPALYYPGDSFVNIIGLDVYDTEWASYPGAAAEFAHMESQPYGLNWLDSFAAQHGKPMSFPEWGLGWGPSALASGPVNQAGTQVSGGDDPTFVADMAHWIATHNVTEATFWDYGTSQVGGGQNPQTLAALRTVFAQGQFGPPSAGAPTPSSSGGPATFSGRGIVAAAADGGIFAFGAPYQGSLGGQHLNSPIVGMAYDSASGGYYEVAADGGIFAFGAPYQGSLGGQHLNSPIVGMAYDSASGGYYEVAADGGIFDFGAPQAGSLGGQHLNSPIVGMGS
jgi:hypothetical protein